MSECMEWSEKHGQYLPCVSCSRKDDKRRIAELEDHIKMLDNERLTDVNALNERIAELAAEAERMKGYLHLIIFMDPTMFTLEDACTVAIEAVSKENKS